MTAVLPDRGPEMTSPGWGVFADLTPPELISARRAGVMRRWMLLALVLVVVLVGLGYVASIVNAGRANSALADEQSVTAQLTTEQNKYNGVTRINGAISTVQGELATLMTGDVEMARLIDTVRSPLPRTMAIATLSLTVNDAAATAGGGTGSSLDTSGEPVVGRVTLSGTAKGVRDVAAYVTALNATKGVVDVLPSSNSSSADGYAYTISLGVTDQVLSHRYDVTPKAKPTGAPGPSPTTGAAR